MLALMVEITNGVSLWRKGRQKALLMTAADKQRTMEKAENSILESEQATNAEPGNCTLKLREHLSYRISGLLCQIHQINAL